MMNKDILENDMDNIVSHDLPWEKFFGKTVLITGANGFLPAYMLRTLLFLNRKYSDSTAIKVIALVRNYDNAKKQLADVIDDNNLSFLVQDVCDKLSIDGEVNFIIHAASQASPKFYGVDPVGTLKANVIGTLNLLELAREKKTEQFFYFSTGDVYGHFDSNVYYEEEKFGWIDPLNIHSCYGESKRMAENMCICYMHQYGIDVRIARIFHAYGPGVKLNDGRSFADFISNVINNQDIVLNSDGSAVRAFCYISDATKGFFTIMLKGEPGNAYNVGNENNCISIFNLANIIVDLVPEKKLSVKRKDFEHDEKYLQSPYSTVLPNCSKLKKLGWLPDISIKDGFLRTLNFYL